MISRRLGHRQTSWVSDRCVNFAWLTGIRALLNQLIINAMYKHPVTSYFKYVDYAGFYSASHPLRLKFRRKCGSKFLVMFPLAVLVSCQGHPVKDETSPNYVVPVGSTLTLHKTIELPPGRNRALIQAGHHVDAIEFPDLFFPHCFFDINRDDKEASQVIRAGEFRVKSVIRRQKAVVPQKLVLANEVIADAGGNGFIDYIHATEMALMPSAQPEEIKLVCQVLGGVLTDPLNIRTIRRTLGRLVTLKLANN